MKALRNIWPLFFLLLSVACAVFITVKLGEHQNGLPGGVLAVLDKEDGAKQDFLIVEKEDGSPLYKNGAVERIRKEYGITESDKKPAFPRLEALSGRSLFSDHAVYMEGGHWMHYKRLYRM